MYSLLSNRQCFGKWFEVYPNPHMMDYQDGSFDMTSTVNVVYEDGIDEYTKDRSISY